MQTLSEAQSSSQRFRFQIFSEFPIKVLAIAAMIIDHFASVITETTFYYEFADSSFLHILMAILRDFGRIAFPLFIFMLVEGMRKGHHQKRYILTLGLFSLAFAVGDLIWNVTISGKYALDIMAGSAFTDLFLYAVLIYFWEKKGNWRWLCLLPILYIGLSYAGSVYQGLNQLMLRQCWNFFFPAYLWDWYTVFGLGVLIVFYFAHPIADAVVNKQFSYDSSFSIDEYRKTSVYQEYINVVSCLLFGLFLSIYGLIFKWGGDGIAAYDTVNFSYTEWVSVFACIPILLYNGQRGYDAKWFRWTEYLFYPIHIVLFAAIFYIFWFK